MNHSHPYASISDADSNCAFLSDSDGFDVAVLRLFTEEDISGDSPEEHEHRAHLLASVTDKDPWQDLVNLVHAAPGLHTALDELCEMAEAVRDNWDSGGNLADAVNALVGQAGSAREVLRASETC